MGDMRCYCGLTGELQMDIRNPTSYYRIVHHQRSGLGWSDHNSKRTKTHYIGNKYALGVVLALFGSLK